MWGPIITILRTQPILIYYLKGFQSFGPPKLRVPPPLVITVQNTDNFFFFFLKLTNNFYS